MSEHVSASLTDLIYIQRCQSITLKKLKITYNFVKFTICDTIKGNESLVKNFYFYFLDHFLKTSKWILMQTLLQLDIWLQSYEG